MAEPAAGNSARWSAALVAAAGVSMVGLFLLPPRYFVVGTFVVTSAMAAAAYSAGAYGKPSVLKPRSIAIGLLSAALLYGVFYAGNAAIVALKPLGLDPAAESAIYGLIASPSNPLALQGLILLFDSLGYESLLRGVVQARLSPRLGVGAAPAVALLDAGLHAATFNPLWVATTFVADLVWGLTYRYGRGLTASTTSHFVWDVAIFIVRPIT
ncbi:MAG: CPBP family intramembrane metalloprotease [Thaumarchaeota archaeon]|nr:CPBP family intramembrane metalloprotease [Nitrososphaerota archaeon]